MASLSEIKTEGEAYNEALETLGIFLQENIPHREVVFGYNNIPIGNSPYLVADILPSTPYSGGFGQQPIYYEMGADGKEVYVYKDKIALDLIAYIGDEIHQAHKDMRKVRTMLNNRHQHYKHFGSKDGRVGVTDIQNIVDATVDVYERQYTQQGARLRLALTYIYKVEDDHGEFIEEINGTTTTKTIDEVIVKDFNIK